MVATRHCEITISVDVPTDEAFKQINNVTAWWTENLKGKSKAVHDSFTVRFDDVHISTQKVIELIPNKKIVWLVSDSTLNFIQNKQEWTNTKIIFDIQKAGSKTEITFTHEGLQPNLECYHACSSAWTHYIKGSLLKLLQTGKGTPEQKG